MKKLFILIVVTTIALSIIYGYKKLKKKFQTDLALHTKVADITDKIGEIGRATKKVARGALKNIKKEYKKVSMGFGKEPSPDGEPIEGIVLYLKHGGVISGKFLGETENDYSVEWGEQEFVIDKSRVKRVEYKTQKSIEWSYKNDVVVRRTNGVVLDAKIIDVKEDALTLLYLEGGGQAEVDIEKKYIEYLLFAPVFNKASEELEESLKIQFPKMEFYKEGNFTIITDSDIRWVNQYKKELRAVNTEIYFKFFKLFKNRKQNLQNFVIIFDNFWDYAEYAISELIPFWLVRGYFSPINETLCTYNSRGQWFEDLFFDWLEHLTGALDKVADTIKSRVDERYHMTIDAQKKKFRDMYFTIYNVQRHEASKDTLGTVRHEFTHEIFHNWGLQSIVMSKIDVDKEELAKKKKEFLETVDPEKKEELLMELAGIKKQTEEYIEMEAGQSWLAEGIAAYCETDPIGSLNEHWLFGFQEMERKNEVNPIEFLMVFKMGSFPGLSSHGQLNAYAESWAFVTFLMDKYPDQFLEYHEKMSDQMPKDDDEELAWLLEALGKDLPTLEKEFREYIKTYEEIEDPYVKKKARWLEIQEKLTESLRY